MLRKNLSFLASLLAVIMLLGMQKPVKADDNLYTYTISGSSSATLYAQCYAANYGGSPSGYLYFYENGSYYNGYIAGVSFSTDGAGNKTSTVTSYGFLNGYQYTTAVYVCTQRTDGSVMVTASVNGCNDISSSVSGMYAGYAYMW